MIDGLIDKVDTVEIVRDRIAAILAAEINSQMGMAVALGQDPELWRLRIFLERSNAWDILPASNDVTPIVNVWWDNSNFDMATGNTVERQKSTTIFNVDCYAYAKSGDNPAGGHIAGDQQAAQEVHRAVRLVRNILMSADYTYLELRGVVWRRWLDSISIFQPAQDNQNANQVIGARLAFRVEFSEYSPQVTPVELQGVNVTVHRSGDGEVILEADYDYTV